MLRWHVISAVFWRNVKQYFSGVLGYLFIVVFVTICAVMAFNPQFFADNIAGLDQLSNLFPILLLFFIPAVTMGVWADEKRQGTDAILFTLPASNAEILLGKYLSVAAVYTVALFFSTSQLLALNAIGDPDWGVIVATYLGYWLSGLALLSIGMFASSLTSSATVAFVLGAIFCAVPIMTGYYFRGVMEIERWSLPWNLQDFTIGLVPISNVVYFLVLTVFMLYLNLIVIGRRHWNRSQQFSIGGHFLVRVVSFAIGLASIIFLVDKAGSYFLTRADLTGDKIYTLDQATIETIEKARSDGRQVEVQAFVSKQVPRKFVNTKKQFVGLLRQYAMYGGSNVNVKYIEMGSNSNQETNAKQLGVKPREDLSEIGGRTVTQDVYLGAHIASSDGDVTLPFLDEDAAIEYELSRSIATTTDRESRITVAILDTDAHFGGPEMDGRRIDWAFSDTIRQLKKQFEIKHIAQDELNAYVPTEKDQVALDAPDVLLVADPSSLDEAAMAALVQYVSEGHPTLILADPLPFFWASVNPQILGVLNAPSMQRVNQRSPYVQILTSSSAPKHDSGKATNLLKALGLEWQHDTACWAIDNPHPKFQAKTPEYLGTAWPENYGPYERAFVWVRNQNENAAFDSSDSISSGLKELLFFYPGSVKAAGNADIEFTPLVTLGEKSGQTSWENLTDTPKRQVRRINRNTGQITTDESTAKSQFTADDLVLVNPNPQSAMDDQRHVVAARIKGVNQSKVNAVFIADTDFVSNFYHQQQDALEEPLDNLTLLQNAIEVLAGDEAFVSLRSRRPSPRTLTQLEAKLNEFRTERTQEQEAAEKVNRDLLDAEQEKLNAAAAQIQKDQSLSMTEKLQKTFSSATDAQRKYDLRKLNRDRELKETIDRLKSEEQQKISSLESQIRTMAIFLAPLPALLLGIFVLVSRSLKERRHIVADRRV